MMKLNFEHLKEITTGAVNIKEENGGFSFSRFTEEQQDLYQITNEDFYKKTFSTAGIKFCFKTNSKNLYIKLRICGSASSRKYFSLDIFVNKKPVGFIDNFSDMTLPCNYTKEDYLSGDFSENFMLGDGEKVVCVYLPWSVKLLVEEISIDENSFVEGVKPKKKLLAFGDSITQGYDALRPFNRYAAKLAEKLDAEEFNKGIGGEIFFPELAKLKDAFEPDYITVAYGTNDWNRIDKETFKRNCLEFYENLSKNYPNSKIFAITPIWRKDCSEDRIFGVFETVEQYIRELNEQNKNIIIISGYDFVPKDEKYFADLRLHPNDEGFDHYYKNLYEKSKQKFNIVNDINSQNVITFWLFMN